MRLSIKLQEVNLCFALFVFFMLLLDLCSHQKSVVLYAKSKRYPIKVIAKECSSYFHYKLNDCYKIEQINIGYTATNM